MKKILWLCNMTFSEEKIKTTASSGTFTKFR